MKKIILCLSISCFFTTFLIAQKKQNKIEITTFTKWNNYPEFNYTYNNRATKDHLKMKGNNYGISINYKYDLGKRFFIKAGIGYSKYNFNQLNNTNSLSGNANSRPINYISPLFISYSTNKYHYNLITINAGIEKQIKLKKEFSIIAGCNLGAHYTFSQYYHLVFNPYDQNLDFKNKESGFFGFSSDVSVGIVKQIGKFQFGPSLILPLFDNWQKDPVFQETSYDGGKNKWLNGIGVGIICNIFLPNKN